MQNLIIVVFLLILVAGGYYVFTSNVTDIQEEIVETQTELAVEELEEEQESNVTENGPSVTPITHATMVWTWDDVTFYIDPVGGAELFEDLMAPDVVLLTDIHGDHLNVETLEGVISPTTVLVVPQAVFDELPETLQNQSTIMANGDTLEQNGFTITAMPMYNLPETEDSRHVKGRGNGYVVERDAYRVYVAGDTAGIPEMRALKDIDMAFVPMNLPYTMSVTEAADAVLAFAPAAVVPYHYRGPDGLADVAEFKRLVNAGNASIQVLLLDWYPEAKTEESES